MIEQFPLTRFPEQLPEFDLPEFITSDYPHVSILDLQEIFNIFIQGSISPEEVVEYEQALQQIKLLNAPEQSSFYQVNASSINQHLEVIAEAAVSRTDVRAGVIHLDRYVGRAQTGPNFARLSLSRGSKDELVSRIGTTETPETQLAGITSWINSSDFDEIVLVDDVLAFGGTFSQIVDGLRRFISPDVAIRFVAAIATTGGGWRGIENVKEKTGVDVEFLTKVQASEAIPGGSKGMAIPVSRDMTLFGGKVGTHESGIPISYPYLVPFSKPMGSLTNIATHIDASREYLAFSKQLVHRIEASLGGALTINDMLQRGFGVPHTSLGCLQDVMQLPDTQMRVTDYIDYSSEIIDRHQDKIEEEAKN